MQATRKHFWGLIALAAVGLTFAPHTARPAAAQSAPPPRLGVKTQDIVFILEVQPGSAAARAGLQAGDAILSVNGQVVPSGAAFVEMVKAAPPGAMHFHILRGSKQMDLDAALGDVAASASEAPAPAQAAPAVPQPVPTITPAAGVFQGQVTTADGRPVAGAEIDLRGLTAAGNVTDLTVYTKANGAYKTHLPPGSYHIAWAWAHVSNYAGKDWKMPLATDVVNTSDQDITDGVIANLKFPIQGRRVSGTDPDDPGAYFGGRIQIIGAGHADDPVQKGSSFELTLTPTGPLMDSSIGKTLVLSVPVSTTTLAAATYKDIPLGQYTATARVIMPDGTPEPLQLRYLNTVAADSLTLNFPDPSVIAGVNEPGTGLLMLWAQ